MGFVYFIDNSTGEADSDSTKFPYFKFGYNFWEPGPNRKAPVLGNVCCDNFRCTCIPTCRGNPHWVLIHFEGIVNCGTVPWGPEIDCETYYNAPNSFVLQNPPPPHAQNGNCYWTYTDGMKHILLTGLGGEIRAWGVSGERLCFFAGPLSSDPFCPDNPVSNSVSCGATLYEVDGIGGTAYLDNWGWDY